MGLRQATERKNRVRQTSCEQCGICCAKGGAALHGDDLFLVREGLIPLRDLITIRKGEFAHNPRTDKVQATRAEIVKLRGRGSEWTCCYYDPRTTSCSIYEKRPLACRVLQCWDPEASLALVETDLLSRLDILEEDEQLQELVRTHDRSCPLPDFVSLSAALKEDTERTVAEMEALVNTDLRFRNKAVAGSEVILREELFLLGRPLFQLVQPFGLQVFQAGQGLRLQWKGTMEKTK